MRFIGIELDASYFQADLCLLAPKVDRIYTVSQKSTPPSFCHNFIAY